MDMVAEGIETQAQLDWLRTLGCRFGQGFWFSRPVDLGRLKELLELRYLPGGGADAVPDGIACGIGKE
jgi:EAL domain-containing protein (putative c-di-GMP-specific phosphodiesterase class I)